MSVTKRTTKVVSYKEQDDDDDDFIQISNNTKNNRTMKSSNPSIETKSSKSCTTQPPQKHEEKLFRSQHDELNTAPKLLSEITFIDTSITIDDKDSTSSQSTVSSNESRISSDQDENLLPKSKRMKHEEAHDTDKDESDSENERKEPLCKPEETIKKIEMPTTSSVDFNTPRTASPVQQNFSIATSDLSKRRSSAPLGFPTSKINISSSHASRVGLSRKSLSIKPLHPNINSRIVPE